MNIAKRSIFFWKQKREIEPPSTNSTLCELPVSVTKGKALQSTVLSPPSEDGGPYTIYKLPAELLILIFEHVLSDYLRGPTYRISYRDDARIDASSIISITHVCRWWRDVAIGCSLFWLRIDNVHIDRSRTFLERSQDVPTSLYWTTSGGPLDLIALDVGSRLRRLDVTVLPGASDIVPSISRLAELASLVCFTVAYSRFVELPVTSTERVVLFGLSVLQLRALAIHLVSNWLPANSFPCLTHLYLDFSPGRGDTTQLVGVVGVLRNAPRVRFVHVSGFSWVHRQLAPVSPLVHLQYLHLFLIAHTSIEVAFNLLSSLILPRHAYVRLHGMLADPRSPTLPTLPVLPVVEGMDRLEIVAEAGSLRLVAEGHSSGLWLQTQFERRVSGERRRLDRWFLALQTALPVRNVTTLLLSLGDHADLVSHLLPRFTGVREICLVSDIYYEKKAGPSASRRSVARAMYASLASPEACPLLHSICVDIPVGVHPITPNIYAAFIADMMTTRSESGLPVPLLGIQAFAGCRWSGDPAFDDVAAQFMSVAGFNEVQLLEPGPYLQPFLERLCWTFEGPEEYWDLEDVYKPMYQ